LFICKVQAYQANKTIDMLKSISWNQLISFLLIATLIYYGCILFVYFKLSSALMAVFSSSQTHKNRNAGESESESDNLFKLASELAGELQLDIQRAGSNHWAREEFILSIQGILKQYAPLKSTPFQTAASQLIVNCSKERCAFELSEEEISRLWNG
jgi:hypothetical protein